MKMRHQVRVVQVFNTKRMLKALMLKCETSDSRKSVPHLRVHGTKRRAN